MPAPETEELSTYELGGRSLLFRPRSFEKLVIREIWKWDDYFLSSLTPGTQGWIVDVGAHIGAFAVKAHDLFPGRPVVALEPAIENFRLLERNLERNGCLGVLPLNVALAANSGSIELFMDPKNTAGHSTALERPTARRVQAVSLSDLWSEHRIDDVYLLKLDCEGAEYEILESPDFAKLGSRINNVVFEHHPLPGKTFEQVQARLEQQGFTLAASKPGYLQGQGTALFRRGNP